MNDRADDDRYCCQICKLPFDEIDHIPKILQPCGHTLCSTCLAQILAKGLSERRCPFENRLFPADLTSVDHFMKNFALLEFINRELEICNIHA